MDNIVSKFEEALKANKSTKRNTLYGNVKIKDTSSKLKLEHVILDVSRQIQAIQKADASKHYQKRLKKSDWVKSEFIPINVLSDKAIKQDGQSKFETQCVSDTQLVDLVKNAEILVANMGVTQEFDITFCQKTEQMNDKIIKDIHSVTHIKTDSSNEVQQKQEDLPLSMTPHINSPSINQRESLHSKQEENELSDKLLTNSLSNKHKERKILDNSHIIIPLQNTPENSDSDVTLEPVESCEKSPILHRIRPIVIKNSKKPSLVYKLESFEKFEAIALPIIEEHPDLKIARQVINSQIFNNELFINTHKDPVLQSREMSKSTILSVKEEKIDCHPSKSINYSPANTNNQLFVEDEILFSSDEETNESCKNIEDLPLTCALETSFYNETGILDKTMYVGFQTASNKSIQVHTDSFMKAKNVLDATDMDLTDLVKVFDNSFKGNEGVDKETEANNNKHTNVNEERSFSSKDEKSNNICDIKFQTANGNPISISSRALMKSKALFEDINSDDDSIEKPKNSEKKKLEEGRQNSPKRVKYNDMPTYSSQPFICESSVDEELNVNDRDIIYEFENKLVQEDENKLSNQKANSETSYVCSEKFQGFKTASFKPIKVSEQAMLKTRKIFDEFNVDVPLFSERECELKTRVHCTTDLIKNTSNMTKPCKSNKDPDMENSRTNMQYINKIDSSGKDSIIHDSKLNRNETNSGTPFNGFKTASNNPIKVSLKSMTKYKNIFQDILAQDEQEKATDLDIDKSNETHQYKTNNKLKFCFHTANEKPVEISEESYIFSQRLLQTHANEFSSENSFQGFKTASNKTIKITKEALAKCQGIINDMDLKDDIQTNRDNRNDAMLINSKESIFEGFQTASNKKITVSNKSMEKYKTIFNDIDADTKNNFDSNTNFKSMNVIEKDDKSTSDIMCFTTASNKPVKISKEALTKTRNIFNDIDVDMVDLKTFTEIEKEALGPAKFQFQTANKRPVGVSDEAIEASQRLLNSDVHIDKPSSFQGFKTASNKKVRMSEDVLLKTKKVFEGIDLEFGYNTNSDLREEQNINKTTSSITENSGIDKNKDAISMSGSKANDVNIKDILNTQVIDNFEETLYTEDFLKDRTPVQCKRSGSPILSCPKVKRRKFQTPATIKKDIPRIAPREEAFKNTYTYDKNYKKDKKYTLKDLDKLETDKKSYNDDLIMYNIENILDFQFKECRNDVTNTIWTTDCIKEYFLQSVDKKIVPAGWIENHLKLIIWKLISYEIRFPSSLQNVCTVRNVLDQLKYRYDRELYKVERPALRKILERDDVASKTLVLCVVGVYVDGEYVNRVTNLTANIELLLSDGWYTIKATIDKFMAKLIYDGKIFVGMKIITHGAELINCDQGVAPWEDTSSVRLKISGNSTRRALWDARLGYHGNGAILSPLSAVKLDGGKVAKLRLYVTRVYPMMYIEKFEDGSTVARSERLEHLYQMKYENDRQMMLEKIYEEVEKEFSDQESQDSEGFEGDIKMESGSQIAKLMKRHKDPSEFRACLSDTQLQLLQKHTLRQKDKQIEQLQEKVRERIKSSSLGVARNVVTLMKIRVASFDGSKITKGMLSIWRPNEAIQELISEDNWIDVYNVIPTAIRNQEIHLSACRNSIFQRSKKSCIEKNEYSMDSLKRRCYPIHELRQPKLTTDYNEVDTVGIIISIEPSHKDFETSKQLYQNVYLSDESKNVICINFWGGIKKFGFDNILDTGQIIACVNLQKRSGNTMRNITQYRSTEYSYFTKIPKYECLRKLSMELVKVLSGLDKRKFCEECVSLKNNTFAKRIPDVSPYRLNNSDYNLSKNKNFIDSPVNRDPLNLSGLDFESSFNEQELSPKKLLRKQEVNKRIAKLKFYGEPPPLSPINIIQKSNVTIPFKSPLTSHNVASNKDKDAISMEKENTNVDSSPVLNVKSVKRIVVPVKLNFNKQLSERDETLDPFAEEFDASPPLSLD